SMPSRRYLKWCVDLRLKWAIAAGSKSRLEWAKSSIALPDMSRISPIVRVSIPNVIICTLSSVQCSLRQLVNHSIYAVNPSRNSLADPRVLIKIIRPNLHNFVTHLPKFRKVIHLTSNSCPPNQSVKYIMTFVKRGHEWQPKYADQTL
ncbi:hypothetical protein T310_6706, partial [Rasamsonia emersonii CBS 393.64]